MKSKLIYFLAFAVISFSLNGCDLLKKRVEKKENVKYSLNAFNKSKFTVINNNGTVEITSTNDSNAIITIQAEIISKVRYDKKDLSIDNIKITIDSSENEIKLNTEILSGETKFFNGSDSKVNYIIKVPDNLIVSSETVNGSINITNINNDVFVQTVNGDINIGNCSGLIKLNSVNGTVNCNLDSNFKSLQIDVVNGSVNVGNLKNINAEINAQTVNGKVKYKDLSINNLSADKRSLTGTLGLGGKSIIVNAVNGKINFDANKVNFKKSTSIEIEFSFDVSRFLISNQQQMQN
jgi:DUF4097 and DUF4098 domain-containing protein YvlB